MENYIPFDKNELVEFLIKGIKKTDEQQMFKKACTYIESLNRKKLLNKFEKIESVYLSLDPDRNTMPIAEYSKERKINDKASLIKHLRELLKTANYTEIPKGELRNSFIKKSPWGLKLKVSLEEFSDYFLFYRNEYPDTRIKKIFFIFKKTFHFNVYSRVVLLFKFKEGKKIKKRKDNFLQDKLYIKLFKNVPTVDIEMLFPNTKITTSTFDKIMIFAPLIAGICTSIYQIINFIIKQGSNTAILLNTSFLGLIGGLFGAAFKGFFDYQKKVDQYLKTLASNLYFQNLDNNTGVYEYLLDNAEDEEFKEIIVGYYFLLFYKNGKINSDDLDAEIENFFIMKFGKKLDFEISDSIRKLKELGLAFFKRSLLEALPLSKAVKRLRSLL